MPLIKVHFKHLDTFASCTVHDKVGGAERGEREEMGEGVCGIHFVKKAIAQGRPRVRDSSSVSMISTETSRKSRYEGRGHLPLGVKQKRRGDMGPYGKAPLRQTQMSRQ